MLKQMYMKFLMLSVILSGMLSGCSSPGNSFADVYRAASAGDGTYLAKLTEEGASLDTVNEEKVTPLCYAYLKKNQTAVDLLTAYGAQKGSNCFVRSEGASVSYATAQNDVQKTRTLVQYVPEHNPPQKQYPTPMNNSAITTTFLSIAAIAGIVILICIF